MTGCVNRNYRLEFVKLKETKTAFEIAFNFIFKGAETSTGLAELRATFAMRRNC